MGTGAAQGSTEVREFLVQFGDLAPGVDAWWWLGCHARDHGRHQQAIAAFLRLANHPHASGSQRTTALRAILDATATAGQLPSSQPVSERLLELERRLEQGFGGQQRPLTEWMLTHTMAGPASVSAEPPTVAIAEGRRQRPVLQAIWKSPFTDSFGTSLAAKESKQRDLGVRPIPILRPLVVGNVVIARTLEGIYAIDLKTGEPKWQVPNIEFAKLDRRLTDNPSYQSKATDWAQRRTLADSIFAHLETDGSRLFAVQEPDRAGEFGIERSASTGVLRTGPAYNLLCSYSLVTGALQWTAGEESSTQGNPFGGMMFLGCPRLVDDTLYVIAQRETEMQLLALDPVRGSLTWSLTLGAVLLPVAEDLQRSRVACPVIWHDGKLICSTGAGAVIAVDPLLRTIKWGYRYSATTVSVGDLQRGQNSQDSSNGHEPWWDAWRDPFMAVDVLASGQVAGQSAQTVERESGLLVFASPETDQLHAIRFADGTPQWQIARGGGVLVAGIVHGVVVVVEGDFVRGHEIATGRQLWRTPTSEIGGPGSFVGPILMLTAQSGGTMLLDVRNGQLISESTNGDAPRGALLDAGLGWIALNRQSLMLLPKLEVVRQQVEAGLLTDPNDETLRLRAAFLDLQAGDSVAARGRLEGIQSSPARELRRQAIIDALRDPNSAHSETGRSELARQLKELAEDVEYKFAAAAAIGASALAVIDLPAAVDAALDGLATELDQPEALVKTSAVVVREEQVAVGFDR